MARTGARGLRPRAHLRLGALLLAAALIAAAAPALGAGRPHGFAYAVVLNAKGEWVGPLRNGEPDLRIFEKLREADPRYARIVTHVGTEPDRHVAPVPQSPEVLAELNRLGQAGIRLGLAINSYWVTGSQKTEHLTVQEVLDRACVIREQTDAAAPGMYDWIFLDFALQRSTRKLQQLTSGLRAGQRCGGQGWRRVMTNATNYTYRGSALIPRHTWAHASRLSVMNDGPEDNTHNRWRKRARQAVRGEIAGLRFNDRKFIRHVHHRCPASRGVLKLEIPHQTAHFAELPRHVQRGLLREWAKPQVRLGFKLIFPLYVQGGKFTPYDSRKEGTFRIQKRLMRNGGRLPRR